MAEPSLKLCMAKKWLWERVHYFCGRSFSHENCSTDWCFNRSRDWSDVCFKMHGKTTCRTVDFIPSVKFRELLYLCQGALKLVWQLDSAHTDDIFSLLVSPGRHISCPGIALAVLLLPSPEALRYGRPLWTSSAFVLFETRLNCWWLTLFKLNSVWYSQYLLSLSVVVNGDSSTKDVSLVSVPECIYCDISLEVISVFMGQLWLGSWLHIILSHVKLIHIRTPLHMEDPEQHIWTRCGHMQLSGRLLAWQGLTLWPYLWKHP